MKSGFPTRPAGRSIRGGGAWEGVKVAKIESVKDLPEWFDLDNYSGCDSFGAAEWYEVLFCRSCILRHLPYINSPELAGSSLQTEIENTRRSPTELPDLEASHRQYIRMPVANLTFGKLLDQCYGERWLKLASSDRWDLFSSGGQRDDYPDAIEKMPMTIQGHGAVTVDLGATDSVILESFGRWLKSARAAEKRNSANIRNKPTYDRWGRYGLLPYLDLQLWAMETGTHIPDRVMSAAISHYDAGEANLRKTLAPLASELMQGLSALHALAAIEAATRSPINPETFEH